MPLSPSQPPSPCPPSPCPYLFPSDSLSQSVSISFSVSAIGDSLFLAIRHSGHRAHAIHVPQARRHARCMLAHTHQRRARKTERLHAKPSDSTRAPCGTHARRPPSGSIAARVHAPRPHGRTSRATPPPSPRYLCTAGRRNRPTDRLEPEPPHRKSWKTLRLSYHSGKATAGRPVRGQQPVRGADLRIPRRRIGAGNKTPAAPTHARRPPSQPHPFAAMGTLNAARTHADCIHSRTHARRLHTLKHTRPPAGD